MSIYTKTGDGGTTVLYGGKRVLKSDLQIEALGSVDEFSSFIGFAILRTSKKELAHLLTTIQKDLYQIMAFLSGKKLDLKPLNKRVIIFEQIINNRSLKQPKFTGFILPQGSEISVWFHILRTVCRRSERRVVSLNNSSTIKLLPSTLGFIIKYLNRLSDLFFILALENNQKRGLLVSLKKRI